MLHSLPSSWHALPTHSTLQHLVKVDLKQVNLSQSQMLGHKKKISVGLSEYLFFKSPNTSIGVVLKNPLGVGLIFLLVITFSLPSVVYDCYIECYKC